MIIIGGVNGAMCILHVYSMRDKYTVDVLMNPIITRNVVIFHAVEPRHLWRR